MRAKSLFLWPSQSAVFARGDVHSVDSAVFVESLYCCRNPQVTSFRGCGCCRCVYLSHSLCRSCPQEAAAAAAAAGGPGAPAPAEKAIKSDSEDYDTDSDEDEPPPRSRTAADTAADPAPVGVCPSPRVLELLTTCILSCCSIFFRFAIHVLFVRLLRRQSVSLTPPFYPSCSCGSSHRPCCGRCACRRRCCWWRWSPWP